MTKILSFDRLHDDEWQQFGDERVEVATALILDLETLESRGEVLRTRGVRLALSVDGEIEPESYAEWLSALDMVEIRFGKFTDGRGFSSARELRERFAFGGTVRAAGQFIPDQMSYLARVGFDAWVLPEDGREEHYQRELRRFAAAYQRLPGDRKLGLIHRYRSREVSG